MTRHAVKLFEKYVDEDRLKRRKIRRTNRTLAPYYEERFLRNKYYRLKALGDGRRSNRTSIDLITPVATEINTQEHEDEIEKHLRFLYDDSCDDDYFSANGEVLLPPQTRSQTEKNKSNTIDVHSNLSTSFITPSDNISTPEKEQLHILLACMNQAHSDDIATPSAEQQFEMLVHNIRSKKSPMKNTSQTISRYSLRSKSLNVSNNLRNMTENVESSEDSLSSGDNPLVIDEQFNDLLYENFIC